MRVSERVAIREKERDCACEREGDRRRKRGERVRDREECVCQEDIEEINSRDRHGKV